MGDRDPAVAKAVGITIEYPDIHFEDARPDTGELFRRPLRIFC